MKPTPEAVQTDVPTTDPLHRRELVENVRLVSHVCVEGINEGDTVFASEGSIAQVIKPILR